MFRSHILNLPITVHHLHCLISGQISSLFYLSDKISELCRIDWIFCNDILDILVTAQGPATICTTQFQARSTCCFISLIKSLTLNLAGLLEYF